MKRLITLFILFAFFTSSTRAQYNTPQNYNWVFGTRAGVSFASGSPVNISSSIASPAVPIDQYEGSASVSNPVTGALQFYTDGTSVWNSAGNIMPGSAAGLIPYSTWSTTMATLIVPVLSNPNQYYVFSIEEAEDFLTGDAGAMRMYYCIVDMTLAGGLGNVVPGTLGTFFASPVGEKQIVIPGNNCDLWLVNHGRGNKNFYAYNITNTGINPVPVVSTLGNMTGSFAYGIGVMKSSPNRLRIVTQNWNQFDITGIPSAGNIGTELYDFDPNTGIVSNCRLLDSTHQQYGAEFSSDNTKLYAGDDDYAASVSHIYQYDITGPTATAIRSTKYLVATSAVGAALGYENYGDLRLARNNKIYFGSLTSVPASYLSVINNPNASGAACGYANNVVTLSGVGYSYAQEGMPNVVQNVVHDTSYQVHDTTVCVLPSTGITLTAATGTSYYWNDGTTAATHIATAAGTYWVNVTNACSVISDTIKVHVGGSAITGSLIVCPGITTTLTSSTPGGTWSSSNLSVATIAATGVATGVAPGTTTISYTVGTCSSTAVLTVDVAPPITGSLSVCLGGTTTLSNATGGGTWSSTNTSVATIVSTSGVVTGSAVGTSTISYVLPTGCIATTTVSVVTAAPISGNPLVCLGATTSLSSTSGGGTWSSSNLAVANVGAGTGVVNGVSVGTTTITYTIGLGCTSTLIVTVSPLPAAISGVTSVCIGGSSTLSDATGGGTWSSSNTAVVTIGSGSGVVNSVSAGTATITYKLATGCFITVPFVVNPLPPAILGPGGVCIGLSVTLTDAVAGGTWISGSTGIATIGLGTGVLTGIAAGSSVITYTLPTTCRITTTITVAPQPAAPLTANLNYCQNDYAPPLTAVGTGLEWYNTLTGGTALGAPPVPPTSAPGVTTWYVSQNVGGCESARTPLTVTVHIMVPRPFILPDHATTCQFLPLGYSYNGTMFPGALFQWTVPGNAAITGGSATGPSVVVTFDTTVAGNYVSLTVGDGYPGCSVTDSVPMTVYISSPDASFYIKPDVCINDTVTVALTSVGPGVSDYTWNFGPAGSYEMINSSSNHGGPFLIVWPTPGIKIVTMIALSNGNCPSKPISDTFDVHGLPDATFDMKPKSTGALCLEDSILFSAHQQDANFSYLWEPEHCCNNYNKANIWGRVEKGRTEITLTVSDPFGCTASASQQISPDACCTVLFPTAFSPNGDGRNDVYRPILSGYHNFHEFRIVNRWGQTVFESANSYPTWDGSFGGVQQDLGVYFYYIKYDCGGNTIEEKGDLTLVR